MRDLIYIGGGDPANLTYLQSAGDDANLTTYTFASQNFGDEAADRYIIVALMPVGAASITSVTIGGVSATIIGQVANGANVAGLAIALVPTGTSGSVVMTLSDAGTRAGISCYSVTGLSDPTPTDTNTSTADPSVLNLDVPDGGFIVACSMVAATAQTATWVGATKDSNFALQGASQLSSASIDGLETETNRAITATWSGGNTDAAFSAVWN